MTWSDEPGELGLPDDPGSRYVTKLAEAAHLLNDLRTTLRSAPVDADRIASLLTEVDHMLSGWRFPRPAA